MRGRGGGRPGVSLVEILVATAILALALFPIIQVFLTTGQELKQTLPYYQAVFLGEKAVEHARLASSEDPHFYDRTVNEHWGVSRSSVIGGGHPYFEVLEDSGEPFGKIDPGVDWAIQPEAGALYKQVEPLAIDLGASVGPSSVPGRQEAKLRFRLDWLDLRSRAMDYSVQTPLPIPVPIQRVEPPLPLVDDAMMGQAMGESGGLASVAAARGADAAKLGAFAKILALGAMMRDVRSRFAVDIAKLRESEKTAATPALKTVERLRISRAYEGAATAFLFLLQEMRPPLVNVARSLPAGSLGSPEPPLELRKLAVTMVCETYRAFFDHLIASVSMAQAVAMEDRIGPWERLEAHRCIYRLVRMEGIAGSWPSVDPVRALLKAYIAFYAGRMPNVEHYFAVEELNLDDPAGRYPLYAAATDVSDIHQSFLHFGCHLVRYGLEDTK